MTARTRWVWLTFPDVGRVLAFTYDDPSAGPSAKGAAVGDPPDPEAVRRAIDHPDRTVRDPRQFGAVPIGPEEALRLGLPRDPPWSGHFTGKPIPPPRGEAARVVVGRVVRRGAPVAGARVQLGYVSGPARELVRLDERRSDADGRVRFPLAPTRGALGAVADVEGASSRVVDVSAEEDDAEEVVLELRDVGAIAGTVERAGSPCDAQISIYGRDGGVHRVVSTRPPGRYRIDGVVPGRYEIRAVAYDAGHRPNGVPGVAEVEVPEGGEAARDFVLTAGTTLHVVVYLEEEGTWGEVFLVAGATAPGSRNGLRALAPDVVRSANSMSSKDCRMWTEFRDVAPGTYVVCVTPWDRSGRGAADQPVECQRVEVADEPLTVTLPLPPTVMQE